MWSTRFGDLVYQFNGHQCPNNPKTDLYIIKWAVLLVITLYSNRLK